MHCEYNWLDQGLHRKFTGNIDTQYILKSNFELHSDDRFQSLRYVLNDFREITTTLTGEEDVRDIAEVDAKLSTKNIGLKVAIVIANNPTQIALALLFSEIMEKSHYKCKVFVSRRDAMSWLTLPELVTS